MRFTYSSHTNHENHLNMMDTRLEASPRNGGEGKFFYFFITNPPRGRPFEGRRQSSQTGGEQ